MGRPETAYLGKRVLVTGGLGFIGSSLAIRLVGMGADVTLVDCMLPLYGGNLFNVQPVRDAVAINYSDIRDRSSMEYLVRGRDFIFHLAGQLSHVDSLEDPFTDVDININGTLAVLEACRLHNRGAVVVFAGTRGQYGTAVDLPVSESAPTNPKGIYAVTNLAAERLVLIYNDIHDVPGVSLRITNTYGPRHQMKHDRYGVANFFVRKALDNGVIPIMGDGRILRDFLYIDDLVDAILLAGSTKLARGEILNVGTGIPVDFRTLGETIVQLAGSGRCEFFPFSKERLQLEPGDFYSDISRVSALLGWKPRFTLQEGLESTIEYYREFQSHYWERDMPEDSGRQT
jgi:UDP-glucose 4-epimerase